MTRRFTIPTGMPEAQRPDLRPATKNAAMMRIWTALLNPAGLGPRRNRIRKAIPAIGKTTASVHKIRFMRKGRPNRTKRSTAVAAKNTKDHLERVFIH
jgi:hypothetical protein